MTNLNLRVSRLFDLFAIALILCSTKNVVAQRNSAPPMLRVGPKVVADEILVRFRPAVSRESAFALHAALHARVISESSLVPGLSRVRIASGSSLHRALRGYRKDSRVLYAEPNYIVHALNEPNDPLFSTQWNLQNTGQWGGVAGADIHIVEAWGITTGSADVAVGVIDTGVDYTHADLGANIWKATQSYSVTDANGNLVNCPAGSRGFNMVFGTCDPLDDNGHGTHVSGIIGAMGNNAVGVAGVNWQVQIIPCKFIDATGAGDVSGAIACLEWLKSLHDSGTPIIATNNSWGGGSTSQALADAISAQAADGILFVAAADNNFLDNDIETVIPAGIFSSNLISVAATTNEDTFAAFSDIGPHSVHLGAPGQEVLSTFPGNSYVSLSGTSMAAPHVTGVAALLKAANPSLDWRAIRNLILTGGDTVSSLADTVTGKRLDAYGSLTCSSSTLERRLQPTVDVLPATVGQAINLAVINVNCGNPAGGVQVTVQPGGQTITLLDSGQSPDQTAGDGIYTGVFTPQAVDNYLLTFPGGDTVQVEVLNNYAVQETSYNYVAIAGTNLNLADDAVGTITSPFPVHFGGATFNTVYVSSNGTLSFTNLFDDYVPERIPVDYFSRLPVNPAAPAIYQPVVTLLAPWWQDLTPVPNTAHNVFWDVAGTAPNRNLVIEWRDLPAFECAGDLTNTIKFQVVLSESSDHVISNYADTQFGGNCSAGDFGAEAEIGVQISQTTGTEWDGIQAPVNPGVVDGMALLWSIPGSNASPNPVPQVTSISPKTIPAGSGDTWVTLTGTNFVPATMVEIAGIATASVYVSSTEVQFFLTAASVAYQEGPISVAVFNPGPGGGTSNTVTYKVTSAAATITSLSPSSIPAGSFGFVLTVNGTNLHQAGDLVFDNGTGLAVLQISSMTATQIQAIVPDYLVAKAATATVYFEGPVNSNQVTFPITASGTGASQPPAGSSPSSIEPSSPKSFGRFPGWNEASRLGANYLNQFLRPRANLASDTKPIQMTGVHSSASTAVTLPLPGLGFRPNLPADFLPDAVVTGDFNHDGKTDWAVANAGSNNVWIYLGNGDGTSQIPSIVTLRGYTPVAMAVADMNGDGKLDLVVVEADSLSVAVLLGNGDGTFQPERVTYVPGVPLCLAVADFNGDGHQDVVVGLGGGAQASSLAFLAGDGKGNLEQPTYHFGDSIFNETIAIAVADLNRDGLPDLVISQFQLSIDGLNLFEQMPVVGAAVYLNAGNGSFKMIQLADPDHTEDQIGFFGHAVTALALGDVNHDGCIDLVTVDQVGLADYLPGLCDGTFDTTKMLTIGVGAPGAAAALVDLNRDGNLDLVVSGFHFNDSYLGGASGGDVVSVSFGNGDGTFGTPSLFRGEPGMYSFATTDLNGDGAPDIVTANQNSDSVSVYLNDGTGAFGSPSGAYLGYSVGGIVLGGLDTPKTNFAFADVNGDGHNDLIFFEWPQLSYQATDVAVMLGDGQGHFAAPVRSNVLHTEDIIQDFVVGDFRNSGQPDILILDYNGTATPAWAFAYLQNSGNGSFQKPNYLLSNSGGLWPTALVAGDFNHDGNLDVVVLSYATGGVSIVPFLGHGDGTFTEGTPIPFSGSPTISSLMAGDFDQDGNLDLLFVENGSLYRMAGRGDGTFQSPQLLFSNFGYFTAADLNGDGILDLVEVVATNSSVSPPVPLEYKIYLGQKGGAFQLAGTYGPYQGLFTRAYLGGTANDPTQIDRPFVADFNGDGKLDIAAYQASIVGGNLGPNLFESGPGATELTFLLGNGDGTFTPSYLSYGLGRYSVPQLAVDLNGDKRADLVQLDTITSSYHTIPAVAGPSFAIQLVSDPIVDAEGTLRITLAFPSPSGTTVQLTASDSNISLPATASIAAGSFRVDVPFRLGSNFNANRVFQIQAQIGTETHRVYGTKASSSQTLTFAGGVMTPSHVILASQMTPDYGLILASIGGYSTEITLSCQGLPAGASCQFGTNPIDLGPGVKLISTAMVATPAGLALGAYPFTIQASDGTITQQIQASFSIGDFAVSAPQNQTLLSTGSGQGLSIAVTGINQFTGVVTISCNAGLPTGLNCPFQGAQLVDIGNYPSFVSTQGLAPGTYQWTITGSVGSISHSTTVPLYVFAQEPSISASINPASATISAGSSANFTVRLQSQNGAAGPYTFSCISPPSNLACSFNPSQTNLMAGGSSSTTLTIAVSSQRALAGHAARSRANWLLQGAIVAGFVMVWMGSTKKQLLVQTRVVPIVLAVLLATILLDSTSCGGGSGSSSPPSPPPPSYTYQTINVQITGPGTSTVSSISVGVPQ